MNSKPSYNVGFNYKGEFITKDDDLNIDWEYKFRYNRPKCLASILCSNSKVEVEAEYWCLPKKEYVLKTKLGLMPGTEDMKESKILPWNTYNDAEFKYHGIKHFYGALKLAKDYKVNKPTVKLTGLYKLKPQGIILGGSCTYDSKAPQFSLEPLELLVGLMPNKNMLFYLKHSATNFNFKGTVTAGLFKAGAIELSWPKTKKDQVVNKVYQYKVQAAAEASLDMVDSKKIKMRAGMKVMTKKAVTFQTMIDNKLNWLSALTYHPSSKLNFVLSSQLSFSKFNKDPNGGFYDCGFTVELLS
jgi:hypothetical protein